MKARLLYIFGSCMLIGLTGLVLAISEQLREQHHPTTIPTFRFPAISGVEFRSDQLLRDRQTIVMYASPDCIYCHEAVKILAENQEILRSCQLIMIFPFEAVEVEKFFASYSELASNPNLIVLLDPFREFPSLFGPSNFPSLFVYGENGELIKKIEGLSRIDILKQFIGEH